MIHLFYNLSLSVGVRSFVWIWVVVERLTRHSCSCPGRSCPLLHPQVQFLLQSETVCSCLSQNPLTPDNHWKQSQILTGPKDNNPLTPHLQRAFHAKTCTVRVLTSQQEGCRSISCLCGLYMFSSPVSSHRLKTSPLGLLPAQVRIWRVVCVCHCDGPVQVSPASHKDCWRQAPAPCDPERKKRVKMARWLKSYTF